MAKNFLPTFNAHPMSDNWDSYFARVNGAVSSILVDLGIRNEAPDLLRPHILWIWVPMLAARDDGLSSDVESPTLHKIEDALTLVLAERNNAVLAGRITGSSRREYYFYGRDADGFSESILETFSNFPAYVPEFGEQPDAGWSQYLDVLYPAIRQLQQMKNRQVIAALSKAGDSLIKVRPITHWLYFRNAADQATAASSLAGKGFRVSRTATENPNDEFPLGLSAVRDDPAEQDAVDRVTFLMIDAIEGMEASYDGWESPLA